MNLDFLYCFSSDESFIIMEEEEQVKKKDSR